MAPDDSQSKKEWEAGAMKAPALPGQMDVFDCIAEAEKDEDRPIKKVTAKDVVAAKLKGLI